VNPPLPPFQPNLWKVTLSSRRPVNTRDSLCQPTPEVLPRIVGVEWASLLKVADLNNDLMALRIDADRERLPTAESLNNRLVADALGRMIRGRGGTKILLLRPLDDPSPHPPRGVLRRGGSVRSCL
jgi:hypothetical protein